MPDETSVSHGATKTSVADGGRPALGGQIHSSEHRATEDGAQGSESGCLSITDELAKANEELQKKVAEVSHAKAVLAAQSGLLEAFFKHTLTPLVFLDRAFNFIRVNEAYARAFHRDVSDFPEHNHFEFFPDEENRGIFKKVVETKTPHMAIASPFVFRDHPEREVAYWNWTLFPLLDESGDVDFLFLSLEDVTASITAERQLRQTKEKLENTLESISDGFFTLDKEWRFTYLNREAVRLWNMPYEKLIGNNIWDVSPREIGSIFDREYHRAVQDKVPVLFEALLPLHNVWVEVRAYPSEDGLSVYLLDIDNKKRGETHVKVTNDLLKLFSGSTSRKDYLDSVAKLIKGWTGCCCVGVGVLNREGNIPYESSTGFDVERGESRDSISIKRLQYICMRIMLEAKKTHGRSDMTPFGSFRSDNTFEFFEALTKTDREKFGDLRIKTGFKSMAIIPIRYGDSVVGGIHLADKREGMVPLERVEFIESLSTLLGEAIHRFNLDEEMHENYFNQAAINLVLSTSLEDMPLDTFLQKTLSIILSVPWLSSESSGCIHLVEHNPDLLVMRAQRNVAEELKKLCSRVPFGKCLCGRAASTRQVQFADHVDDQHDICCSGIPPHGHYAVPIVFGGRTLGVITIYLGEWHTRDRNEEDFLETIANTLAGIIVRRRSEHLLKKSQESLSEAQRIAHIGNWDWDIGRDVFHWSDEIYHIFGLTPETFGATFEAFLNTVHPEDRMTVKKALDDAVHGGNTYSMDHRIVLPGGDIRIVHEQGEALLDEQGNPVRMAGTIQDISARKMAEEELRASREKLRHLNAHLQSVREKERTEIAREIHDEFGTILTALKIDLSWLEKRLTQEQSSLAEKTRNSLDLINAAIKAVQRISSELRPGILDHLGLASAVEWHVKEFGSRTGISCDISVDMDNNELDRDISTTIFRILQEALTNIARHSEATEVSVCLKQKEGVISLSVADNGKGILEDQLSAHDSFGLMGIKERVKHWLGDVTISSAHNKGTIISVSIPLENKEKNHD